MPYLILVDPNEDPDGATNGDLPGCDVIWHDREREAGTPDDAVASEGAASTFGILAAKIIGCVIAQHR